MTERGEGSRHHQEVIVIIIGELLNASRKSIAKAIESRDTEAIKR